MGMRLAWHGGKFVLGGIVDDAVAEKTNVDGGRYDDDDRDRVDAGFEAADVSDPSQSAQAWVVVPADLLMDYRYLDW